MGGEDWEIDHPEPWRITHRTNVHELEALHRKCNREKGGSTAMEIKGWDNLRKGQREAIQMIESRVARTDAKTTAIVLPCRYGKSDVIRLVSTQLWATGRSSAALALSPGEILRDQLSDAARWDAAYKRYGVILKRVPQIITILKPKARFNPNGEAFLSATIQLAQVNLDLVCTWVESEVHRTGLPVIVFIDECHSSSDKNEWGKVVPALITAGAHVVLLTATPERADGQRIHGFRFNVVDEGEIKIWRSRPHQERPDEMITVDVYEGRKQKIVLEPDYAVTFGEAWNEVIEGDPILCKISRQTFDCELHKVDVSSDGGATWLSELKPDKAREVLGRVVRHPVAIGEGCRRLLAALDNRRDLDPHFQAIVYCGNDIEGEDDKHLNDIKTELVRQRKSLKVRMATMASSSEGGDMKGKDIIESFAGGMGDVLLVKQMAGMGLDLPWVKVGLDLSPTRTFPALVQRMFRPATPHEGAVACEWISVDDVVSAAYFQRAVTDQGGEATATDMALTDTYDKERKDRPDREPVTVSDTRAGKFDDCSGRLGEPQQWEQVEEVLTLFPRMTSVYTHAEIAELVKVRSQAAEEEGEAPATVRDTGIAADALRGEINDLAKKATHRYLEMNRLPRYGQSYGNAIKTLWTEARKASSWPYGVELSELDDLNMLQRMHDAWVQIGERLWPTTS